MSGLEELQAAELDEGNSPRGQLDLQQITVMSGAHEHRVIAQALAVLRPGEYCVSDHARLLTRVVAADQPGAPSGAGAVSP